MDSPIIPQCLIVFHILVSLVAAVAAQPPFRAYRCTITADGNYTSDSTYGENLKTLLSEITSDTKIQNSFYNLTSGQDSDEVYGIALCSGGSSLTTCHRCLNDSSYRIRELCPYQREAIGWYDDCMLRYSSRHILGLRDIEPTFPIYISEGVSDVDLYTKTIQPLLSHLQYNASAGDSENKFATGSVIATDSQKVYALAQCTPDLSEQDCSYCIGDAINYIPSLIDWKQGARVFKPSCNLRFETNKFYTGQDNLFSPRSNTTAAINTGKGRSTAKVATIVSVTAVASVAIVVLFFCVLRRRTLKKDDTLVLEDEDEIGRDDFREYNFDTIKAATGNFSEENKLGRGGFGVVYQGTLSDGREIAVKRLAKNSGQGEVEFKNEVLLVARLQHRNLVRLIGFCLTEEERLLIYEYMPNGSLDRFLFNVERHALLDWEKRYRIIGAVVRGMVYLHEDSRLRIIHRDLKAANILLDSEMNAKIADFGLAKLVNVDQTHGNTSSVAGTYGYIAPEYLKHGLCSIKSDVYSFGVLVLEIMCGQRNIGSRTGEYVENLTEKVWRKWKDETVLDIVDPTILVGSMTEIMRCIHIGLLCVQESVADRPTMSLVALMLSNYSLSLPKPSPPAYVSDMSSGEDIMKSSSKLTNETTNQVSLTEEFGPR